MEGNFFIPGELLARSGKSVEVIEREILQVLGSNLPDDTKYKLFQNSLHRYQQLQDQLKKPVEAKFTYQPSADPPIPFPELPDSPYRPPTQPIIQSPGQSDPPEVTPLPSNIPQSVMNTIARLPKTRRDMATLLVENVLEIPEFKIDDSGRISYKGETANNSNMVDIISDFGRNVNQSPVPGAQLFAKVLKDANVPLAYIANKHRHNLVKGQPSPKLFHSAVKDLNKEWKNY